MLWLQNKLWLRSSLWQRNSLWHLFGLYVLCAVLPACSTAPDAAQTPLIAVPLGLTEQSYPSDNVPTAERIELGRQLFFSAALSRTGEISCASCHRPENFFADNKPTSAGVEGRPGTRNVPSLINVGYQPYMLREGGVPTLEMQVLVPIQEHNEFDDNILVVVDRLAKDTAINAQSIRCYNRKIDSYSLVRAIASFERSLVSTTSRYDEYNIRGRAAVLTNEEHNGRNIFFGEKGRCGTCHNGIQLTNFSFQNNGLYDVYPDSGRFRVTKNDADIGVFKVPSLRNVSHTAPYMFNGSVATLEEVVLHYNSGGKSHVNKKPILKPLNLTVEEQKQLVAFLKAL